MTTPMPTKEKHSLSFSVAGKNMMAHLDATWDRSQGDREILMAVQLTYPDPTGAPQPPCPLYESVNQGFAIPMAIFGEQIKIRVPVEDPEAEPKQWDRTDHRINDAIRTLGHRITMVTNPVYQHYFSDKQRWSAEKYSEWLKKSLDLYLSETTYIRSPGEAYDPSHWQC